MARFAPADEEELARLLAGRGGDAPSLLATGAPPGEAPEAVDDGAGDASDGSAHVSVEASAVDLFSTARLSGIHALRPRDLTVTVGAGTRVEELLAALAEEGLWLAVSGTGRERSVGGWVAAAEWDPLDATRGDLRRQLLACQVVTPAGEPARWGRAVLKDVAGYGVTRAIAGSRGTLGVLHRATFRLWPAPETDRVVVLRPADGDHAALAAGTAVSDLDAEVRPDAATWRSRPGGDPEAVVEVRLLGTGDSVELREGRLRRWAEERGVEAGPGRPTAEVGGRLRGDAGRRERDVSRLALAPGRRGLGDVLRSLARDLPDAVLGAEADLLGGRLRCRYRRDGTEALERLLEPAGDAPARVERGSAVEIESVDARRPERVRELEARVRDALSGRPRHWMADHV